MARYITVHDVDNDEYVVVEHSAPAANPTGSARNPWRIAFWVLAALAALAILLSVFSQRSSSSLSYTLTDVLIRKVDVGSFIVDTTPANSDDAAELCIRIPAKGSRIYDPTFRVPEPGEIVTVSVREVFPFFGKPYLELVEFIDELQPVVPPAPDPQPAPSSSCQCHPDPQPPVAPDYSQK